MNIKKIVSVTLIYTITTFFIAIGWHIGLFKSLYLEFGYFTGEPNLFYGFLTMVFQGLILSSFYPYVKLSGTGFKKAFKYSMIFGLFQWTLQVLALVAKQNVPNEFLYIAMESFYLFVQFSILALILAFVYKEDDKSSIKN